ncbi:ArsR/SmtB family transcription factor [Pontivivens insulae]|uniref:Biofilm growth-associated repressor n=1 Tax=Pontivivens insulae TaxID=1639689 RepID=A0A2R8AAB8_9RHOB|nr:metalloregulator ArsR/SmtB family transcription factor [Pontivivens insulae]RED13069.1 ArsR family transcriptional regulator [Pontivivens insulae]SPF29161.1 Biofilm growth-associated repressor [Pontivivens insulae]
MKDLVELEARADEVAARLKLMGNPARLLILCQLAEGEQSVGALLSRLNLSQSALSQHLAKLRAAGLVATRRDGLVIHYRIADAKTLQVMQALYETFCAPDNA